VTYRKRRDPDRAGAEFQQGISIEPDVGFNYDQIGGSVRSSRNMTTPLLPGDDHPVRSQLGLAKIHKE
jgi:hypothetical protein